MCLATYSKQISVLEVLAWVGHKLFVTIEDKEDSETQVDGAEHAKER